MEKLKVQTCVHLERIIKILIFSNVSAESRCKFKKCNCHKMLTHHNYKLLGLYNVFPGIGNFSTCKMRMQICK